MSAPAVRLGWTRRYASFPYVAPFAAILCFLALAPYAQQSAAWFWPLQVFTLAGISYLCWPRELSIAPKYWLASTAVGVAVFLLWIAPDILFPGYRNSLLFSNALLGQPHSSLPLSAHRSVWVLAWRMARASIVVPIAEELFWRGWLLRWLILPDFKRIPLGTYAPAAFWSTAVLFASEHGPYWDVGLITGVIYNAWLIRSKSLADCILMHAVTNAVLSAYVLASGNWQYWM